MVASRWLMPRTESFPLQDTEQLMWREVNNERTTRKILGLLPRPALRWDDMVARVARRYSRALAQRGFKGHIDPEGKGIKERLVEGGLTDFLVAGENIAGCAPNGVNTGFVGVEDAMASLLASRSHRRNILSLLYTGMGCGKAVNPDRTFIFVQVFIR